MRLLRAEGREGDPRGVRAAPPGVPEGSRAPSPTLPRTAGEGDGRRRVRLALPLAALIVAAPVVAFGAAWTLPRGTGQVIVQTAYTQGSRYLREGGAEQPLPEYRKLETSALVEYGLTDGITLMALPSVFGARTGGAQRDDYTGLGYTDLGARARIWHDEQGAISLQALARLPGPQDDRRPAQLGNTDAQLDFRLLAGRGFTMGDQQGWVNAELAYRQRFEDPPNEWRIDLTLGWRPTPGVALIAQSFNVIADGQGRGVYPHYWYSKAQLSALYEFSPGWSIQAGAFRTIAGENALRETGAIVALWKAF